MGSVDLLKRVAPNWVTVIDTTPDSLRFRAKINRAGGIQSREYRLRATSLHAHVVSVSEEVIGTLLPAWCPERHVNPGGSFCLGLNAGNNIGDLTDAAAWWRKVEVFLECQEVAHNTGRWPLHIQLSHGEAGAIQLQAEEIAKTLNRTNELEGSILFNSGVIAKAARQLIFGVRHSRAECLCGRKDKHGKALIRKTCQRKFDDCLILLEVKRRGAVKDFWTSFKNEKCCGSISTCPLQGRHSL